MKGDVGIKEKKKKREDNLMILGHKYDILYSSYVLL